MMKRTAWATFVAATTVALSAHAATITGGVTSDGKAVRGALVTLFTADGLVSETVFSDGAGRYRLSGNINGASILRVRTPLHADEMAKLTVPAGDAKLTHSFAIRRLTTPQEISDSLPASAHFTRIKLPTTLDRQIFQLDCVGCHQIGNPLTRRKRSPEEWTAFMHIMTRNAEYPTDAHVATYASVMAHAFDGTPVAAVEQTAVDEKALTARVFEWKLPGAIVSHDSEFYPPDGTFYSVEQNIDQLYVTDPKTNKTTVIPIPPLNGHIRGTFADEKDLPSWVPAVRHGVHSLQLGPDGMFYMTGSIGGEILVFDPAKRTFKSYPIGHSAMYPHTPRFDSKGILWFTMYVSNQIGRFDPKTGHMTVIELPNIMVRSDGRITAPYGIDINPLDGSVWYTKLWANKIGRIDPVTFHVQEWVPPVIGPRRARFDDKGGFWIPGFGDGKITRLDTKTMTYKTYNIPTLAPNEVEAPYALAVEPKTQNVWVTVNMSDRMFRFEPTTETWTAYPLPTRGLFTRDVVFASDGMVCGSSNPWGLPQKDIVEGDMDSLICVQPEGNQGK